MFEKFFEKHHSLTVTAPVSGEVISLSQVDDPTFAQEILGKGAAIRPTEGRIVSPFDGTVEMMFDTGHAVSLTSNNGIELLIHVGIDTVKLKGAHYTTHVKSGDTVKAGQLLMECDLDAIRADGYDTVTPVIVCNSDDFKSVNGIPGMTSVGHTIIKLTKK